MLIEVEATLSQLLNLLLFSPLIVLHQSIYEQDSSISWLYLRQCSNVNMKQTSLPNRKSRQVYRACFRFWEFQTVDDHISRSKI